MSEVANPRPGDQLTVGGEALVVQGEPERRDPDQLAWSLRRASRMIAPHRSCTRHHVIRISGSSTTNRTSSSLSPAAGTFRATSRSKLAPKPSAPTAPTPGSAGAGRMPAAAYTPGARSSVPGLHTRASSRSAGSWSCWGEHAEQKGRHHGIERPVRKPGGADIAFEEFHPGSEAGASAFRTRASISALVSMPVTSELAGHRRGCSPAGPDARAPGSGRTGPRTTSYGAACIGVFERQLQEIEHGAQSADSASSCRQSPTVALPGSCRGGCRSEVRGTPRWGCRDLRTSASECRPSRRGPGASPRR